MWRSPTQSSAPWTKIFQWPEPSSLTYFTMNGLGVWHATKQFARWCCSMEGFSLQPWKGHWTHGTCFTLGSMVMLSVYAFWLSSSWQTFMVFFSVWLTRIYLIVMDCGDKIDGFSRCETCSCIITRNFWWQFMTIHVGV